MGLKHQTMANKLSAKGSVELSCFFQMLVQETNTANQYYWLTMRVGCVMIMLHPACFRQTPALMHYFELVISFHIAPPILIKEYQHCPTV